MINTDKERLSETKIRPPVLKDSLSGIMFENSKTPGVDCAIIKTVQIPLENLNPAPFAFSLSFGLSKPLSKLAAIFP